MPDKKKPAKTKLEVEEIDEVTSEEEKVSIKEEIETDTERVDDEVEQAPRPQEAEEDEVKVEGESKAEEDPSPYFTRSTVYGDSSQAASVEKRFSGKRLVFFLVAIAVSAGIFFAGLMFFNFQFDSMGIPNPLAQATPTPTVAPTATLTPEPEVDLSELQVQVLNGSGVSGAAADAAALLEEEGFENIEVGNAEDQDLEETEVQLQEGVSSEVYSIISSALSDYSVVEGAELDEDADFDVIVTLGQPNTTDSDSEEPTETPTPTEEE